MSNVHSEDPGPGPAAESPDAPIGGSRRVRQTREEITGRGWWSALGTFVATLVLLAPIVWLVVQLTRWAEIGGSGLSWAYASLVVLAVSALVWFAYQTLRGQQGR